MVGGESEHMSRPTVSLDCSTVLLRGLIRDSSRKANDGTKKAGSLMNLNPTISDLVSFYPSLFSLKKKEES